MPAVALSRVGARVAGSGPEGETLTAGTWERLESLPDPRSPQGRVYPLACLVAIAAWAFTAGNDRFTAVGQWIKRADQGDLARLRAPWDPVAGRYRAPDEKTIRVVLDRLDPRALARALLGPPRRRRPGCPSSPSVRGYPARRACCGPKRWPAAGYGRWPWTARPPAGPAAAMAPGSTSSVPPSTAGACWIAWRSMSSTTRPPTSPNSRS